MSTPLSNRLRTAQQLLLGLVLILSSHTHYWVLWQVDMPNLFVGFRAALLYLFDLPLIALLVVAGFRLFYDTVYGEQISDILNDFTSLAYGGLWWGLIIIWIGIGAFWAKEPALARFGTLQTVALLAVAIITAQMARNDEINPLLWALCLGAVIQSAIAIAQFIHGNPLGLSGLGELQQNPEEVFNKTQTVFRGYGLTAHPNILAGYLLIGLCAASSLIYRFSLRSAYGLLAAAAFCTATVGLLITFSRTGLVAGAAVVIMALVLKRPNIRQIFLRKNSLVLALAALGIILIVVLLGNALIQRNWGLQDIQGVKDRVTLGYSDTVDVIESHPILGVGENNLMVAVGHNKITPDKPVLLPAHNVFLVIQAELGIAGLVLFGLACITILIQLFRRPTGGLFIWTLGFLALFLIMPFDYYVWMDYRSRLLLLWTVGMWWGYRLHADQNVPA